MIIISSISLAFENPLIDPTNDWSLTLYYIDIVMTIIFGLEVLIKVIAHGFLFNGS